MVLSFFICLSVDMIVHLYFQEGIFQIGEPYLYDSISASHVLKVQFSDPSSVGCVPIQRLRATELKTFTVCRLQVQMQTMPVNCGTKIAYCYAYIIIVADVADIVCGTTNFMKSIFNKV